MKGWSGFATDTFLLPYHQFCDREQLTRPKETASGAIDMTQRRCPTGSTCLPQLGSRRRRVYAGWSWRCSHGSECSQRACTSTPPRSTGALPKLVARGAAALAPPCDTSGPVARVAPVTPRAAPAGLGPGDRPRRWGRAPRWRPPAPHPPRSTAAVGPRPAAWRGLLGREGALGDPAWQGARAGAGGAPGRTGPGRAAPLPPPRASDVSAASRSGDMPGQRHAACSALDHTARVLPSALYPVIRYGRTLCLTGCSLKHHVSTHSQDGA
jgi:hypothetical protein